jgi:hypothetical protein
MLGMPRHIACCYLGGRTRVQAGSDEGNGHADLTSNHPGQGLLVAEATLCQDADVIGRGARRAPALRSDLDATVRGAVGGLERLEHSRRHPPGVG